MNITKFGAPRSGALYAVILGLLCLPCLANAQTTEPAAAPPPAASPQPGQPVAPQAQPYQAQPGQPYAPQAQPYQAQPGQPYQPPPGQAYQAQPGQPYQAQPGQPYYQAQPGQPYYQGQPGQPYQPQPAPRARRPRASPGMMISGIAVLGATYMVGAITGAVLLDVDSCDNCRELGTFLLIPVAGPFLAMGPADNGRAFLALFGLAQTAGAALMIGGIVKYVRSKKQAEEAYAFKLSPRHTLSVDVATSPYLAGPKLSLRF